MTMAFFRSVSRLNSVDFPTFGRPMMAMSGFKGRPLCSDGLSACPANRASPLAEPFRSRDFAGCIGAREAVVPRVFPKTSRCAGGVDSGSGTRVLS